MPDQLRLRVTGHLAELVVDVGHRPGRIGHADERRLVHRVAKVLELFQRGAQPFLGLLRRGDVADDDDAAVDRAALVAQRRRGRADPHPLRDARVADVDVRRRPLAGERARERELLRRKRRHAVRVEAPVRGRPLGHQHVPRLHAQHGLGGFVEEHEPAGRIRHYDAFRQAAQRRLERPRLAAEGQVPGPRHEQDRQASHEHPQERHADAQEERAPGQEAGHVGESGPPDELPFSAAQFDPVDETRDA